MEQPQHRQLPPTSLYDPSRPTDLEQITPSPPPPASSSKKTTSTEELVKDILGGDSSISTEQLLLQMVLEEKDRLRRQEEQQNALLQLLGGIVTKNEKPAAPIRPSLQPTRPRAPAPAKTNLADMLKMMMGENPRPSKPTPRPPANYLGRVNMTGVKPADRNSPDLLGADSENSLIHDAAMNVLKSPKTAAPQPHPKKAEQSTAPKKDDIWKNISMALNELQKHGSSSSASATTIAAAPKPRPTQTYEDLPDSAASLHPEGDKYNEIGTPKSGSNASWGIPPAPNPPPPPPPPPPPISQPQPFMPPVQYPQAQQQPAYNMPYYMYNQHYYWPRGPYWDVFLVVMNSRFADAVFEWADLLDDPLTIKRSDDE